MKSHTHQVILFVFWAIARAIYFIRKPDLSKNNVLLIPSDPTHLVGARGDEAMLTAALQNILKRNPGSTVYIACSTPKANSIAESFRAMSVHVWKGVFAPLLILKYSFSYGFREVYLMGADIMDGHYSGVVSLRMVIAADIFSAGGAQTSFLGFSLNDRTSTLTGLAFRWLNKNVSVNVRDAISLQRFKKFSGREANLVADTAFLLEPAKDIPGSVQRVLDWVINEKRKNKLVIAVNFHPMLFGLSGMNQDVIDFSSTLAEVMSRTNSTNRISWLLLPHDDRKGFGDIEALTILWNLIGVSEQSGSLFVKDTPSAAELKLIAGAVDGVITGRMHLAIATLGQGKPVLAFAYQGKFEGLGAHFQMPPWTTMTTESFVSPEILAENMSLFIENLELLTEKVQRRLPSVLGLARKTFENAPRAF